MATTGVEGGTVAGTALGGPKSPPGRRERADEKVQVLEEERRFAGRRTTLQEKIRLLDGDERLRQEQEAARRRLEELQQASEAESE